MNIFYYLDSLNAEVLFYQIETDLNEDQLKKIIHNEALKHAKDYDLDIKMFLNGEYEDASDEELPIIIGGKIYSFSLMTGLSLFNLNRYIKEKLEPIKIKFNSEETI